MTAQSVTRHIDAILDQAIADHAAGHHQRAEAGFQRVLDADPDHPDALNLLGLIFQNNGRHHEAITLISRALEIDPEFPEALTNLARVQRVTGKPHAAVQSAERAIELDPDLMEAHLQRARALLDLRQGREAERALRHALALRPGDRDCSISLGAALLLQSKTDDALTVFQTVLSQAPCCLEAIIGSGVAMSQLNRLDEALTYHRQAITLAPNLVDTHAALALTLRHRADPLASASACRTALALAPERADLWLLLGANLACAGQFDEASACHDRALSLNPHSPEAWRGLSMLGRDANQDDIARLQATLSASQAAESDRIAAGFSLGRMLDRANQFDSAFQAYAAANRLARQALTHAGKGFDHASLRRQVDWSIATFDSALFARTAGWGDSSDRLVFIVGMPRSGTTLVEQIAATHKLVFGAGERTDIHTIINRLSPNGPGASPLSWDARALRDRTAEHIAAIEARSEGAVRIIDKMPDNILLLGHIAVLFPHARVILCRRDPRDTCLSAFFQQFDDGMAWTCDLADAAARAQEIERLTAHWCKTLPLPILQVSYEDLVTDLPAQSQRLIAFLGLDWDPACLRFHETQRPVMTASHWQVRQPLYTGSVGRWQHYRHHLGPLLRGLQGLLPPSEPTEASFQAQLTEAKTLAAQAQPHRTEALWRHLWELHPDQLEALNGLTDVIAEQGRYDEAIALQRQAVERFPKNTLLLYQLAWLHWRAQDPAAAINLCESALLLDPDRIEVWLLLANCQMAMGQFVDAAHGYRRVLVLDPSSGPAYAGLVQTGLAEPADNVAAGSGAVMAQAALPPDQRIAAAFAMARDHERREDYDAAFNAYTTANSLVRSSRASRRDDPAADDAFIEALREYVDWAIQTFQPETFAANPAFANPSELPGFIVGMPRSGTTLVEQIAAGHPLVFGAGERPDLEPILGLDHPDHLLTPPTMWDAPTIRAKTGNLLARLRDRGGTATRVLNKLPDNILWLGQIALLFPNARIIVCRRDPRDVCLSCFCQNFFVPHMAWTDTLESCATRARQIERLLDHWRQVLPVPFLEVQYETLVGDLEGQTRRLIGYLGVEWDPACLDFHTTQRPVMTASDWQVRQPLYATSVGKWRHYREHLGPLLQALQGLIPAGD